MDRLVVERPTKVRLLSDPRLADQGEHVLRSVSYADPEGSQRDLAERSMSLHDHILSYRSHRQTERPIKWTTNSGVCAERPQHRIHFTTYWTGRPIDMNQAVVKKFPVYTTE